MNRFLTAVSLSTLIAASASMSVFAQDAEATPSVEQIVVRGFALQNQLSVAQKREADTTADFLAADEINRQPDYNIADAFRRAPGVVTIFDEDEGRYVGIRGLDANFTIASLDGSLVASAERGQRRVNLEAIPSSAVKRLEIFKSRTADLEGNAIGGTINLVTRSAFDADGFYAVGSAQLGYTSDQDVPGEGYGRDSDNGPSYRGDFTISDTFMDDKVGFVLSGSILQRRRDQQRFSVGGYGAAVNGVPTPTSTLYQGYPNTIDRLGGFAKLEFKPSSEAYLDVLLSHYTQEDTELRLSQQLNIRGPHTAVDDNTNAFASGQGFIRFNDFFIDKPLFTAQSHFNFAPGEDHEFKAAFSYSESTFSEPSNQIQFTTANNLANLGGTYTYVDGAPVVTINDTGFYGTASNYNYTSYLFYDQDNDDYVTELSADYGFNTGRGDRGLGFDVGVQYRENIRDFDENRRTHGLASGVTLNAANFVRGETFTGPYANQSILIFDGEAFLDYFAANPGQFTTTVSDIASDYRFDEDVDAAYGQAVFAGDRYKVLAGLRWEGTSTSVTRPRSQGGVTQFVTRNSSYDNVLPSITGYYDLADNLKFRASYFRAIGRPNPIDLAGSESVTIAGDGTPTLSRGNPDLRAREADNFDASLEYFFPDDDGLVAAAVFHKDISDDIFRFQSDEMIDGVLTRVTQPRNVAASTVTGVELTWVQNELGFTPAFLDGLGVSANYTYFYGNTEVVGNGGVVLREVDSRLQQPSSVLNAAIFYDRGPLETRLTYAWSDSFLSSISTSATSVTDREDESYWQLDWTGRYDLNEQLQLTAEIRNITNETKGNVQTTADGDVIRDYSEYGRTAFAGVAFKF